MQQTAPIRRAITLAELVVVMIIVLVVAALAVPATVYLTRSQGAFEAANRVVAALLEAQTMAALQKEFRGVALTRSSDVPQNFPLNWFDQLEECELLYSGTPELPPWAAAGPGWIDQVSGTSVTLYKLYIVDRHILQDQSQPPTEPPWHKTLKELTPPRQSSVQSQLCYLAINDQAPSLQIGEAVASVQDNSGQGYPVQPPLPKEMIPPSLADPNDARAVCVVKQVTVSRPLGDWSFEWPNCVQGLRQQSGLDGSSLTFFQNYRVYSLCPMSRNYQQGTDPPQFRPQTYPLDPLRGPVAISLPYSRPNWYPPPPFPYDAYPGAYDRPRNPVPLPIIVFGPDRSVVIPGAAFLQDKTVSGWIVLWTGMYTTDASGNFNMRPEDSVLVGIHTRTGKIATFAVNTDPTLGGGDPYYFVRVASEK